MSHTTTPRRVAVLVSAAAATALGVTALGATSVAPTIANAASASAGSHAGWVAVERAQGASTAVVELVSPTGTHQNLLSVPKTETLVQVTPDAHRVLTAQANRDGSATYRVHDLASHRVSAFTGRYGMVRFTALAGTAVLAQPEGPGGIGNGPVQRLDFSGRRQVTYAGTTGNVSLPSLDGRFLVATTANGQLTVSANATGKLVRVLPKPKGLPYCQPVRNASASAVYVTCSGAEQSQVFRYSLAGGAPVSMTGALPVQQFGYVDYWTQPSGTWVHQGAGCGSGALMKVTGRTSVRDARLPIKDALVGVAANTAIVENSECEEGPRVSAVNLSTRAVTTLFTSTAARPVLTWTLIDPTR